MLREMQQLMQDPQMMQQFMAGAQGPPAKPPAKQPTFEDPTLVALLKDIRASKQLGLRSLDR